MKPIISICIPAYNRPWFLEESLLRILSQIESLPIGSVEIIIVDDSTTYPSKDMISPYLEKYKNIFYLKNEKNQWFINTVTIIKYAKWDYILYVADDDTITDFALEYILELINKTNFDVLIHKPIFSENLNIPMNKKENTFDEYNWINEFIINLWKKEKEYKYLISYFSFYSSVVAKREYLLNALQNTDNKILMRNSFPHEFLTYYNLQNSKIITPHNTFVIWRLLNESYPGTTTLIKNIHEVFNYIEKRNNLINNPQRKIIKKICVSGWTRTIYLWILLKKLHIDYKKNRVLKKVYFLYKKYVQ